MSKNPIVPYILIFALGIGLIFFMSIYGLDQKEEIAGQGEEGKTEEAEGAADSAEFDAEAVAQGKCIGCHGGDLTGGMGPALAGTKLSKDEIKTIIKEGAEGGMPGGLITDDAELDAMADYILSLK
ncbi:cytochrome c550 [Sporosarcina sp. JAI121]|uniref:cytochrome c550 n=1 Tax=Sporosarcina sp. JAI121 TaxID=2723064 RepID=UPI0015CDDF42|nr:cytochrome c [Sporosarcina sp. JAI121]NYF24562.1 cytochrome c550 [Sporosarcina sp. JAI121]